MQDAAARTTRLRELPGCVRRTIEAQRERSEREIVILIEILARPDE
jgi:hypothetical protein